MSSKKAAHVIGCVFVVVMLVLVFGQREFLKGNPLESTHVFEQPSFAVTSAEGLMLVIEGSKTKLTVLENGEITATIFGGKSDKGFYYAEYAVSDAEYIYVADVHYAETGGGVDTERIIRYTHDGKFDAVLFEKTYTDDMPLQYGNITALKSNLGMLTFLLKSKEGLDLYSMVQGVPSYIRSVNTSGIDGLRHMNYNVATDTVWAMSLRGDLYFEKDGRLFLSRYSWMSAGMECVPWEIATDKDGSLYMIDLSRRAVVSLPDEETIFKTDQVSYRLTINEENLMTLTDNESIFQVDTNGTVFFSSNEAPYGVKYFVLRMLVWLLAVVCSVTIIYLAGKMLIFLVRSNQKTEFKMLVIIMVSTILTSTIVAVSILNTDDIKLDDKNRINLTQMAVSLSEMSGYTFGDDLESITHLGDYGGASFQNIRSRLDPICETATELSGNMYYVLYKYNESMLYGVMDYEDTAGTIYPMGDFYGSGYDEVAKGSAPYLYLQSSDSYGTWSFAVAPVYNSQGVAIGLIEVGSDLYSETLHRQQQIMDIILSTAVLLVLFLLLFSECMSAFENVLRYRSKKGEPFRVIPELIRPLAFLVFLADNTSAAFIPQLSARIFEESGYGFATTLGAALPLSVKMLLVAVMAFAGGAIIDRFGVRKGLVLGLTAQILGFLLTAAAIYQSDYTWLLIGEAIMGCGLGIIVVTGNTLPVYCEEEGRRNDLFSGVNVGIMAGVVVGVSVGSYVAQTVGYAMTFLLSAVFLIPAIILGFLCADNRLKRPDRDGSAAEGKITGMGGFLKNREVFSFLLLLMMPFMVIMSFKDYVFPLFASEMGYSDVSIGHVLLFSGALAIFVAPALSEYLLKKIKVTGTNILAAALFVVSIFLFALSPTLESSVLVVFILSFAGGFGLVAQGILFSSLRASAHFGVGKAMGVYSLFDNLSQTLGPIVFGALMVFGGRMASLTLGCIALIALLGFAVMNRKRLRQEASLKEKQACEEAQIS